MQRHKYRSFGFWSLTSISPLVLLNSYRCFILQGMTMLILATDMARHTEIMDKFSSVLPVFDFKNKEHVDTVSKCSSLFFIFTFFSPKLSLVWHKTVRPMRIEIKVVCQIGFQSTASLSNVLRMVVWSQLCLPGDQECKASHRKYSAWRISWWSINKDILK